MNGQDKKAKRNYEEVSLNALNREVQAALTVNNQTNNSMLHQKYIQSQAFRHPKLRNICSYMVPKSKADAGMKTNAISNETGNNDIQDKQCIVSQAFVSKNSMQQHLQNDHTNLAHILNEQLKKETRNDNNFNNEYEYNYNQRGHGQNWQNKTFVKAGDNDREMQRKKQSLIQNFNSQLLVEKKTKLPEVAKKEQDTSWTGASRVSSINVQNTQYITSKQDMPIERIQAKRFSEGAAHLFQDHQRDIKLPGRHHQPKIQIGSSVIDSPPAGHANQHSYSEKNKTVIKFQRKFDQIQMQTTNECFKSKFDYADNNGDGVRNLTQWSNDSKKKKSKKIVINTDKNFQIDRLKGQLEQMRRNSDMIESKRELKNQSSMVSNGNSQFQELIQTQGGDKVNQKQKRIMSTDESERFKHAQQTMPSFQNLTSDLINQVTCMKTLKKVSSRGQSESKLNSFQNGMQNMARENNYSTENVNLSSSKYANFKHQQQAQSSSRSPGNHKKLRIIESDQMFNLRQNQMKTNLTTNYGSPVQKSNMFSERFGKNANQMDSKVHHEGQKDNGSYLNKILSQRSLNLQSNQATLSNQAQQNQTLTSKLLSPGGSAKNGGQQKHEYIYKFIKNALENQHPSYFNNQTQQMPVKVAELQNELRSLEESQAQKNKSDQHKDLNRIYELRNTIFKHQTGTMTNNTNSKFETTPTSLQEETSQSFGQQTGFLSPALEILSKHQYSNKISHEKKAHSYEKSPANKFNPLEMSEGKSYQNNQYITNFRGQHGQYSTQPDSIANKSNKYRQAFPLDDVISIANRFVAENMHQQKGSNTKDLHGTNYDDFLSNELNFSGRPYHGSKINQLSSSPISHQKEISDFRNTYMTQLKNGLSGKDKQDQKAGQLMEQTLFNSIAMTHARGSNVLRNEHPQLNYRQSFNCSFLSQNDYLAKTSRMGSNFQAQNTYYLNPDQFNDSILKALIAQFGDDSVHNIQQKKQKMPKDIYRNIPLNSMALKKQKKVKQEQEEQQNQIVSPFDDSRITGMHQGFNLNGLQQNLANIDISSNNPLLSLFLTNSQEKLVNLMIWHVENNIAKDTQINQAIKQSNELIRIANLSYYHQTKSEFNLSIKELRIMKQCGIHLTRMQLESKAFLKSREFQVMLKDKALKMLTNQLQQLQDLPITLAGNQTPIKPAQVTTPAVPIPAQSRPAVQEGKSQHTPRRRKNTSERQSRISKKRDTFSNEKGKSRNISRKAETSFTNKTSNDKFNFTSINYRSPKIGNDQQQQQYHTNYYKFFVGTGNNFPLVRSVIKNRWWFQLQEKADFHKCNLVWTSWFKQKLCNQLNAFYKNPTDINEIDKLTKHLIGFEPSRVKIYARMEDNHHLSNKKCLFYALKQYYEARNRCVFKDRVFPVTFHIKNGLNDPEYKKLVDCFQEYPNSIWIVKPGENTNRGYGICIVENQKEAERKIKEMLSGTDDQDREHTVIIQKYIEKPLLVYKRKFDIRVFGMLTTVNGLMRGYFYDEGYLRTSSKEYNLNQLGNKFVHLTNDAIQQTAHDFGKFESGNKLSFSDFQKYLKITEDLKPEFKGENGRVNFLKQILPQIRHLVAESFRAVAFRKIDPRRRNFCFEIFGFDFMIDEDFTVYLIEANTNPCLETNSSVLSRLIPVMLDSSFRIALDPLLPPPDMNFKRAHEALHLNRYIQVFDESLEIETLKNLYLINQHQQERQPDEQYERFIISDLVNQSLSTQSQINNKLTKSKEEKQKLQTSETTEKIDGVTNHTKMLQDAIKFHGEQSVQQQLGGITSQDSIFTNIKNSKQENEQNDGTALKDCSKNTIYSPQASKMNK